MINPVASLLGRLSGMQTSQGLNQMSQVSQALHNPQAAMQQILQNDPRTKQVMDYVNQNGGDPKTLFYQLAQQKGVDPDAFLNQIKGMF